MRNHEFRGKISSSGKWCFGNLIINGDDRLICKGWDIGFNSEKGLYEIYPEQVVPETAGQYTGLKDRNGVKIFEGDCLRDEDGKTGQVVFRHGRFMGDFDGRTYYHELHLDADKCEVIGNIHDNPELLDN